MEKKSDMDKIDDKLSSLCKGIHILLKLYPNNETQHNKLAKKLDITPGYLSKQLQPLIENNLIRIETGKSSGGRPPNIIMLTYKARRTLDQIVTTINLTTKKKPLPDENNFNKILDYLLDPCEAENVADIIQKTSSNYSIPCNSYYFQFLTKHLNNSVPEERIRVILDATKNFILDMSDQDKKEVKNNLESSLIVILSTNYSEARKDGIHKAAKNLLDELDLNSISYNALLDKYLSSIKKKQGHPEYYREPLLTNHRDHLFEIWLKVNELCNSNDQYISSRAALEKPQIK